MADLIQFDKEQINNIKKICDVIPKTSVNLSSTMVNFVYINNQILIYGGDDIKAIYYMDTLQKLKYNVCINANVLMLDLKNTDIDEYLECKITENKFCLKNNSGSTDLNAIPILDIDILKPETYNNKIVIEVDVILQMLKCIDIKVDKENGKFYIHINDKGIRFIVSGFGRIAISNIINYTTTQNLFISCNYESLKKALNMFNSKEVDIYFTKNKLILKHLNLEAQIGIKNETLFNYNKYLNNDQNIIKIDTKEFNKVIKSLACINKSQRESVTIYSENNTLICECYNPNIGSKKSTCKIISANSNKKIHININLIWLGDAINTIKSNEFEIIYSNNVTNPIICKSDSIHIIAPTINN